MTPFPKVRRAVALALAASLTGAAPAAALPLISELLYDAAGADDGGVFVELWGPAGLSLAGLALEGVNGSDGSVTVSVPLGGAIPADGIFVVADAGAGGATAVANADLTLDFDFQNGPDSVRLVDGATVLDAVGYGAFGAGTVFAGEGSPAPDPAAGSSLARLFADVDTGDNAADFEVLAVPTPGTAPVSAIPEPGTAGLVALGLASLGLRRRR